ncbi:tripartite ATP-independent transporter DctM subunit [Natronocella acetinitrilica]|uniref:Tripartite ATP-independent transporter DctM subunit n=1 Tax=Natronocella acetinitrilica TaxID=414046 RepID=A0AAE3KCK3_9GAMM|nr:TRAP transporter large permease [Natronocella acetinitrilica]MCP1676985.1 tripartite ATP-independent transporter DctM subunit [Natronocella acetinitrilica]
METLTIVMIALFVLFALIVMRIPIALALLAAGVTGLFFLRDADYSLETAAHIAFDTPARYVLIVIPLFIAMGIFAKHGTFAQDAFDMAGRLLRKVRGGLAMATVLTCAGFAAVSGSSVATVASIGPLAIREMRRNGYSVTLAAGVVGAAGTLGVLIPPSVVLVLYGIVSGESIGALLIAGIIPGILSAFMYFVAIYFWGFGNSALFVSEKEAQIAAAEEPPLPRRQKLGWTVGAYTLARILSLMTVVVGGIYTGIVTATEAAGLGAIVAFIFFLIDTVRGREGFWRPFRQATLESISLSSMVFALLVGAAVFTFFLVLAGVPAMLTTWVTGLAVPDVLIVVIILLAFIPLGMFLDPISMLLIAVPLVHPIVTGMGYDGIWFAILVVKLIEIGLITPPFGMNAFVVAGASRHVTVEQSFIGIMRFLPVDLLTVALLFMFPPLILWLPNLMM